ncbi:MAG: 6,7-dimethyl-8-ribityllumazine synthase, partial [Patescibacteria group bacterium]
MSKGVSFKKMNGAKLKIGIAVSRWNGEITESLLEKCRLALLDSGVKEKNIFVLEVPGAYELPYAASHLIKTKKPDAVVCFGCLIKGETMHFEYIAEAVTQGIMNLNLGTGVPVIFGVLTVLNEAQAKARSGDNQQNHGYAWGLTAVEM